MKTIDRNIHSQVFHCLALTVLGALTLNWCAFAQSPLNDSKNREGQKQEHMNDLSDFRVKYAIEIAVLPKVNLKETSRQFYQESRKIALEGREAFTKNNLQEAEEKLLSSLSLMEDEFVRKDYALTLVEEKKYFEALPSCVEAAIVDHLFDQTAFARVEEYPLPMPTLTYALAQADDVKTAAIVYNFTRNKLEKDIKRTISMLQDNKKSDCMTISEKLRLPLPLLSIIPEKTDRKTLIENSRILFVIISERYFDVSVQSNRFHDMVLPNRLAFQMIEEAYAANPNSAELTFYKGYAETKKEMPTQEAKVESIKKAQEWFLSARTKAGTNSPLGKLSNEYIADAEKWRVALEKRIQERKDNP